MSHIRNSLSIVLGMDFVAFFLRIDWCQMRVVYLQRWFRALKIINYTTLHICGIYVVLHCWWANRPSIWSCSVVVASDFNTLVAKFLRTETPAFSITQVAVPSSSTKSTSRLCLTLVKKCSASSFNNSNTLITTHLHNKYSSIIWFTCGHKLAKPADLGISLFIRFD